MPSKEELAAARADLNDFSKNEELKTANLLSETEKKEKEQAASFFEKSELFAGEEDEIKETVKNLREAERIAEEEKKTKDSMEVALKDSVRTVAEHMLSQRKARRVVAIFGILFTVIGALAVAFKWFDAWKIGPVMAYVLLAVGVALFIVGILLLFVVKKPTIDEKELPEYPPYRAQETIVMEKEKEVADLREKLKAFFSRFSLEFSEEDALLTLSQISQAKKDLSRFSEKENAYRDYEEKAAAEKGKVVSFVRNFGFESERPLSDILAKMETVYDGYEDTQREYIRAKRKLEDFEAQNDVNRLSDMSAPAFPETMADLNESQ